MTSDGGDLWVPDPPRADPQDEAGRPRAPRDVPPPQGQPQPPYPPQGQQPYPPQGAPGPQRPPQPGPPPGQQPRQQPGPRPADAGDPYRDRRRADPAARQPIPPRDRAAGQPYPQPGQPDPRHRGGRPPAAPQAAHQPGPPPAPPQGPPQGPPPSPHRGRPAEPQRAPDPGYADPYAARGATPPRGPDRRAGHGSPPPPPPHRGGSADGRALFRDEVPGAAAEPRRDDPRHDDRRRPDSRPQPEQHRDERQFAPLDEPGRERDWRDDYEEAVSATRWDLSPIPSMPVAPRRANPSNLEALIPPRRGRIQGPATRQAAGGTDVLEPGRAPWETEAPERPPSYQPRPQPAGAPKESVGKSSRLMAMGTMASRATGLIRQFMIIATLGTDALGSSYAAGNNLPNVIYILVLGGALNAVFVPQLVRAMNRDRDGGAAYASRLTTLTVVVLLALTAVAVLGAPQLVDIFTSYKGTDRDVAIIFARMCLPQIFFYGVFVILGQILNAQGRFGPMMWTPVLANVITIAAFGSYWYLVDVQRTTATISPAEMRLVGYGTTLGIVVQTITLIPFIRAAGLRLTPRFDWRGAGLGKAMTLAKWTLAFVLVNQVGLLVVMRYATSIDGTDEGWGLASYNSAYMIWGLPQAIITVSVITALLPRMSRAAAERDLDTVRDDISYGLRVTGVAIVPAAFLFLALGPQIAVVLFMHGSITLVKAQIIGYMLMAFSLGLIPFSAQFLMLRGFYAFEDTKSPFTINIWISAANVALSSVVFYSLEGTDYAHWSIVIMCAVYGVAYCVGLALTAAKLNRRLRGLDGRRIQQTYARLIAASIPPAAAAFGVGLLVTRVVGQSWLGEALALVAGGGVMAVLFLACARLMRVEEVEQLLGSVRAKFGR